MLYLDLNNIDKPLEFAQLNFFDDKVQIKLYFAICFMEELFKLQFLEHLCRNTGNIINFFETQLYQTSLRIAFYEWQLNQFPYG